MYLEVNFELCKNCSDKPCLKLCPNGVALNALKCKHCKPEEAPCFLACKKGAIYKITENVLAIDESKCDGCGACAQACPYGAIVIKDGKARKCDLCATYNFEQVCIENCPYGNITLKKTYEEVKEIEGILGWCFFSVKEKIKKLYRKRPKIAEADGTLWYIIDIPEISAEEARLIKSVLEEFRHDGYKANELERALSNYCEKHNIALDKEQKRYIKRILKSLVKPYGPLSDLIEDKELEEIALIGLGKNKPIKVFHQRFGWCNCNLYFASEQAVRGLVNRMLQKTERRLTLNTPRVNGSLPDGSRITALLPPVSLSEPTFTIRKFNTKRFTPAELIKNNTFSIELMALLWCSMQADCSLVIAGNTGSGKTTSLNALLSFVPINERIVIVEETPELNIHHKHTVRLNVCKEKGITMHHLIEDCLRMRPDRVVVSEIRSSEEAHAFINTLLAGQGKGSYTTFHANSADEAIKRLEFLGIERSDIAAIDILLIQRRWPKQIDNKIFEKRNVTEVAEIKSNGKVNLLYSFDYGKEKLERKNKPKYLIKKIKRTFGSRTKQVFGKKQALLRKYLNTPEKPFIDFVRDQRCLSRNY